MNTKIKLSAIITLFVISMVASSGVLARSFSLAHEDAADGDMVAEWLVRPAAAAGTVAGFVTFAVGLPFSMLADNTEESFDVLVMEPFEYTVHRPLGYYTTSGH